MSGTTIYYCLPKAYFYDMKERRLLRRLLDVLLGKKPPSEAGLGALASLPQLSFSAAERAAQRASLEKLDGLDAYGGYSRYLTDHAAQALKHPGASAAFWAPRGVLHVLSSWYSLMVRAVGMLRRQAGQPSAANEEESLGWRGVRKIHFNREAQIAAGLIEPRYFVSDSIIAEEALPQSIEALREVASPLTGEADAERLAAGLAQTLPFFTRALLGEWREGAPWTLLGQGMIVRVGP